VVAVVKDGQVYKGTTTTSSATSTENASGKPQE
jgi:hypothetical protein